ncbi:hypothetical protein RKD31_001021, partial [Streptomyces sp. SAI-163]
MLTPQQGLVRAVVDDLRHRGLEDSVSQTPVSSSTT